MDSNFVSVELGFRVPIAFGIPDSKAPDSGFHKEKFPGFWKSVSGFLISFAYYIRWLIRWVFYIYMYLIFKEQQVD